MISTMISVGIGVGVALLLFFCIWKAVTRAARKGGYLIAMFTPPEYVPLLNEKLEPVFNEKRKLELRPTGKFLSFEPMHERYMKLAEVITALASGSLVFVPKSILAVDRHAGAIVLVLLGFSVLYCVLFMVFLTYFYENFRYDYNSYSVRRFGLVHAFGFGGLTCFAVAYLVLALRFGLAIIYHADKLSSRLVDHSSRVLA